MSFINALLFTAVAIAASVVLPLIAWGAGRTHAASVRHLIWTGVFAILLALPLAALLLPSQVNFLLPAAPAAMPMDGPVLAPAPVAAGIGLGDVVLAVIALWFAGVVFHTVRLALAGFGLAHLHRRSVAHIPHGIPEAPFRGLNWQLRLRTMPGEHGPLTWGVLKPVVLLPKASVTWPRERLMSVLLHEAAHVRRKDCLSRLIAALACALYWPNPLVWLAAGAMRADAEGAADDAVLTAGVRPTSYAAHLVGLAREFSGASLAMSLSMAERGMLDARVEAILDPEKSRSGVNKMDVLKLGVAVAALTAGLAVVRPSLAESPAPVVTPAAHTMTIVRTTVHRDGAAPATRVVVDRGGQIAAGYDGTPPEPPEPPPPVTPPAVPPAPPAAAVPPSPPAPPAPPPRLSAAEKAAIRAQANADAAQAIAEARRALANVNIGETVANAMKQAEQALRDAHVSQEQARKTMARIDIDRIVSDALKKAEVAMRQAERDKVRAERQRVIVERRALNGKGDVLPEDVSQE